MSRLFLGHTFGAEIQVHCVTCQWVSVPPDTCDTRPTGPLSGHNLQGNTIDKKEGNKRLGYWG